MPFFRAFVTATVLLAACAALSTAIRTGGRVCRWRLLRDETQREHVRSAVRSRCRFACNRSPETALLRRAAELTQRAAIGDDEIAALRFKPRTATTQRCSPQSASSDEPAADAADAVQVIGDTDAAAGGKLSAGAREQIRRLAVGTP
jgi:hypothetical protein